MSSVLKNPCSEKEVSTMFDEISGKYDFLNTLLSMNQDKRWRKDLIRKVPRSAGGHFVDVATGTGDVLIACLKAGKGFKKYTGVDISPKMLEQAETKLEASRVKADLKVMSAENLNFEKESLDCITISFGLRNVNNRDTALKLFSEQLKKGGKLCILEFFLPERKFLSKAFMFYFRHILPKIGGLFSSKKAYTYLPESLESFYYSKQIQRKLRELGLQSHYEKSYLFGSCKLLVFKKAL